MRFPEIVTVHEFGHQYFMQLLASNEFEEAWLDEGFNQYYEGRIMDSWYGPRQSQINWFGFRMGDGESSRDGYVHLDNPAIGPAYGNTWELPAGYYGVLTYSKTATWLRTLEGLGDMQLPIDVLVHFENGNELMLFWDGKARSRTFTVPSGSRILWAQADPKQKLYMDTNFNNNSLTLKPSKAPAAKFAAKFLFWLEWLFLA